MLLLNDTVFGHLYLELKTGYKRDVVLETPFPLGKVCVL